MPSIAEKDKNAWIPVVEIMDKGPEIKSRGTQTTGLFYPSSRSLNKTMDAQVSKQVVYSQSRGRIPQLQDYSPGKGEEGQRISVLLPTITYWYYNIHS